jgi:hypothetical protein
MLPDARAIDNQSLPCLAAQVLCWALKGGNDPTLDNGLAVFDVIRGKTAAEAKRLWPISFVL